MLKWAVRIGTLQTWGAVSNPPSYASMLSLNTLCSTSLGNYGVSVVLRSENPKVKAGDHLYGYYSASWYRLCSCLSLTSALWVEFQQYDVITDLTSFLVLENKEGLPWSAYVGVAGMPGRSSGQLLTDLLMSLSQAKLRGTPGKSTLTPRR